MQYCSTEALLAVGLLEGHGVALYETSTYSLVCTLERHYDCVSCLQWWSMENSLLLLAVATLDGIVILYQVEMQVLETQGATVVHEFRVSGQVRAMTLDSRMMGGDDSTLLWTVGDKSGTVTMCTLEIRNNQLVPCQKNVEYSYDAGILGLAMNVSATVLAVCTKSGQVLVRRVIQNKNSNEVSLGEEVFSTQRLGPVRSAVFTKDERRLVFGGYDKTIVVVDTRLWAITRELKVQGTVRTVCR